MLFPTLEFAVFFICALAGAWVLHRHSKLHLLWLLSASYVFYAFWNWQDSFLLLGLSFLAWAFGRWIFGSTNRSVRLTLLWIGCLSFVLLLFHYKYTGFFLTLLPRSWTEGWTTEGAGFVNPTLPLGISFITFHAISLLFDAYRGKLERAPGLMQVCLYISFFPQLIAGPILRAAQFLPQLERPMSCRNLAITRGMLLITLGIFKKVILANYLGTNLVDPVFGGSGAEGRNLQAVYGYAVQIYCDFCGYTDIAIGCALLLGYRFPLNFRNPYCAPTIQDFWRRWHITLSTWLRDYLYIPMGGSQRGLTLTLLFLMITMLIGGLWHGAGWQFVFWGAFHGLLLVFYQLWLHVVPTCFEHFRRSRIWRAGSIALTFHLVCLGWIWFRAPDFQQAWLICQGAALEIWQGRVFEQADPYVLVAIALGIGMQYQPIRWRAHIERWIGRRTWLIQGTLFGSAVSLIEFFGPIGIAPFIYFQF